MSDISILNRRIASGERTYFTIPVTTMADGYRLEIPVHVVNGKQPGPKLFLNAVSHGDAYTGMQVIRRVLAETDPDQLHGTVVAVPCANPIAFSWDSRNTPVDMNNLNRSFPGSPTGWLTDQIAAAVSSLCAETDMLIDWHGGSYGTAINYILMKKAEGELADRILELGLAYGLEIYYNGAPAGPASKYTGTLTDYMISLGKPSIVAEIGSGNDLPFDQIALSVRGVFNVMKKMGMYPGKIELPKTQYLVRKRPLLRPKNGGLFMPKVGFECLNKTVPEGTLLAEIISPLTLEVIERIYAPCPETVFMNMRAYPTKVHPGDYAYILGDLSTAERFENE